MPVPARASPCAACESPLTVARPAMVRPSAWKSRLSARRSPTFRAVIRELSRTSAVQAVWVFPASAAHGLLELGLDRLFRLLDEVAVLLLNRDDIDVQAHVAGQEPGPGLGRSAPARLAPGLWIALIIASSEP